MIAVCVRRDIERAPPPTTRRMTTLKPDQGGNRPFDGYLRGLNGRVRSHGTPCLAPQALPAFFSVAPRRGPAYASCRGRPDRIGQGYSRRQPSCDALGHRWEGIRPRSLPRTRPATDAKGARLCPSARIRSYWVAVVGDRPRGERPVDRFWGRTTAALQAVQSISTLPGKLMS